MFLSQAISLQPPVGIEWNLFCHIHRSDKSELQPSVVTGSVAVPLSPRSTLAVSLLSRQVHWLKTGPFLGQIACNRLPLRSELGLACRNPAHQTVRPSPLYFKRYLFFYVASALVYTFVYVPAAGHIAPATSRNRVGPLPAHSSIGGGCIRAHGVHL